MKKNYIPTINISALLSGNFKNKKEMKILKEIEKASINVGFFQIVGHGISKKSIKDITAVGKNFFASTKLNKMKLSKDANEILNIILLTNAQSPHKNIKEKEFLGFKSDWLIKNSDLDLIEDYLIKNQVFNLHPELTKYLVNEYLAEGNIKKSCEIFSKILDPLYDEYLSKFIKLLSDFLTH